MLGADWKSLEVHQYYHLAITFLKYVQKYHKQFWIINTVSPIITSFILLQQSFNFILLCGLDVRRAVRSFATLGGPLKHRHHHYTIYTWSIWWQWQASRYPADTWHTPCAPPRWPQAPGWCRACLSRLSLLPENDFDFNWLLLLMTCYTPWRSGTWPPLAVHSPRRSEGPGARLYQHWHRDPGKMYLVQCHFY